MKVKTRIRRSVRAISPVISVLLMIAIAVAAALITYAWIMGYMGGTTTKVGKAVQIQSTAKNAADNKLMVYVQNVGQGPVTISSVYVDDVLRAFTPDPNFADNNLPEGKTASLKVDYVVPDGGQVKVKVVTTDGTFVEAKTFPGSGGIVRYRKQITFSDTPGVIVGTQPEFPVLISISGDTDIGGSTGSSGGSADGDHIYFTDTDGTTKLNHEIESFTVSSGAASMVAWVRVPSLTAGKVIYIYYGSDVPGGQQNPTGVWDSNYKGVWHLGEGSGTTSYDSTSNNNDGTLTSTTWQTGKVGNSLGFSGGTSNLDLGSRPSLSMTTAVTVESWINTATVVGYNRIFVHSSLAASPWNEYCLCQADNYIQFEMETSGSPAAVKTTTAHTTGTWYHVVGVYDGSNIRIYLNGAQSGSPTAKSGTITNYNDQSNIGFDTQHALTWNGRLDEIRVSNIARSADWIQTEYNNQNSPGTFFSVGAETPV